MVDVENKLDENIEIRVINKVIIELGLGNTMVGL